MKREREIVLVNIYIIIEKEEIDFEKYLKK